LSLVAGESDGRVVQLRRVQRDLRRRYPIREIGIFGSYVRGDQTEGSDLDIVVDLADGIGLFELAGFQHDLSDALDIKVDLVLKDALKRSVARRILSEAVIL
jgi:uncharacterized protein